MEAHSIHNTDTMLTFAERDMAFNLLHPNWSSSFYNGVLCTPICIHTYTHTPKQEVFIYSTIMFIRRINYTPYLKVRTQSTMGRNSWQYMNMLVL